LYLACEEENLNEYIEILAEREFVEHKERYSSRSLDPGYETSDNDLKKFIDTLESEREEIKKTIKDDKQIKAEAKSILQ
jgi:predicted nucleic-acid-binding protein